MKKVAILRGKYLNSIEMVGYAPLLKDFELTAYTTYNNSTNIGEIPFPVKRLHCPEEICSFLPRQMRRYTDFIFETIVGYNNHMFGLEKELKSFDIIQTLDTHFFFSFQAIRVGEKYGSKVIVTQWENIPFNRELSPLMRRIKNAVRQKAHAFVAITEKAKQALILEGVPSEKINVIPFGIDTEKFRKIPDNSSLRAQFSISNNDIVILFIGRLTYSKGLHQLVYAAKKLIDDHDLHSRAVKFLLVGDGSAKNSIKSLANRLGIEKYVMFAGNISHNQIHRIYQLSDIFVLPSLPTRYWQEQFGMVLVEALACAVPVVSTLSGSIPEIVGDSGLLVPPADYLSLYYAMKNLILNENLRIKLGDKSRQRAQALFDRKEMAEGLKHIYESL